MVHGTHLVHVQVRTAGTEAVQAKLLVAVLLPSESAHDLNGHGRDAVRDDGQAVLPILCVKDLNTGQRDHTGGEAVLLLEDLDGLQADGHLGTSGDESDLGVLVLKSDVATLDGLLNGRTLEVRKVLTGQSKDRGGRVAGQSDVVGSAGLVAISRTPAHHVGQSAEVGKSLNGLMGGTVLTKTDGVVGSDVDDALVRKRRQADSSGGI